MKDDLKLASEVADFLRVDVQRVYDLARANKIPYIRLGARQYRFSMDAIRNWISNGGSTERGKRDEVR